MSQRYPRQSSWTSQHGSDRFKGQDRGVWQQGFPRNPGPVGQWHREGQNEGQQRNSQRQPPSGNLPHEKGLDFGYSHGKHGSSYEPSVSDHVKHYTGPHGCWNPKLQRNSQEQPPSDHLQHQEIIGSGCNQRQRYSQGYFSSDNAKHKTNTDSGWNLKQQITPQEQSLSSHLQHQQINDSSFNQGERHSQGSSHAPGPFPSDHSTHQTDPDGGWNPRQQRNYQKSPPLGHLQHQENIDSGHNQGQPTHSLRPFSSDNLRHKTGPDCGRNQMQQIHSQEQPSLGNMHHQQKIHSRYNPEQQRHSQGPSLADHQKHKTGPDDGSNARQQINSPRQPLLVHPQHQEINISKNQEQKRNFQGPFPLGHLGHKTRPDGRWNLAQKINSQEHPHSDHLQDMGHAGSLEEQFSAICKPENRQASVQSGRVGQSKNRSSEKWQKQSTNNTARFSNDPLFVQKTFVTPQDCVPIRQEPSQHSRPPPPFNLNHPPLSLHAHPDVTFHRGDHDSQTPEQIGIHHKQLPGQPIANTQLKPVQHFDLSGPYQQIEQNAQQLTIEGPGSNQFQQPQISHQPIHLPLHLPTQLSSSDNGWDSQTLAPTHMPPPQELGKRNQIHLEEAGVLQRTQSAETQRWIDKEFVSQFMSRVRRVVPAVNSKPLLIHISKAKHLIRKYLELLLQLEECRDSLANCMDSDELTWQQKCRRASEVKDQFHKVQCIVRDASFLPQLLQRIAKTKKKRESIARKKRCDYLACEEERERLCRINEKIDAIMTKKQKAIQDAKNERALQAEADTILFEVRKKKQDADKTLELLRALRKVRQLRKEAAERKGAYTTMDEDKRFNEGVSKLEIIMNKSKSTYREEEQTLLVMLEEEHEESKEREMEYIRKRKRDNALKAVQRQKELLFGQDKQVGPEDPLFTFQQFYSQAENNLHSLTDIRHQWDCFLVPPNDPKGSGIPTDWVMPVQPSSKGWASTLDCNK